MSNVRRLETIMSQPRSLFGHPARALVAVKVVHTIAWAFFAGCILAIPVASWLGKHTLAAWLIGIVLIEVAILVANRWRCPLTSLAGRFTEERHDNFDIYLPLWLARHNKSIFGVLFCLSIVYAYSRWAAH
jgi:hypothetical protein